MQAAIAGAAQIDGRTWVQGKEPDHQRVAGGWVQGRTSASEPSATVAIQIDVQWAGNGALSRLVVEHQMVESGAGNDF